ncbi:thiolase family protein [Noviherbaspirillum sedimenti]|uniref:Thiolase family protein n=1 Tax=Noviherbaspirillum sedimenti TaxID=2320865 RepID=A0A3A3FWR0_9BURK|nr:thiolase family protein [Noviherbaspirillum sedimenti]RJG00668.1 thiolase family protein [Noviherbaspirillum sedimenti]
MGKKTAAIVGFSEWKPQKKWPTSMFSLEAMAQLAAETLADAKFEKHEIDGIVIGGVPESPVFAPSAVAEYLNLQTSFNEIVDLGGASPAGMIWRAAAAIEVGVCESVLVLCPGVPSPSYRDAKSKLLPTMIYMGGDAWGSPQSQWEIPVGLVAAVPSYAMAAQRYRAIYGYDEEILAKISVQHRDNAQANPNAIFYGKPITVDDVMISRYVADPIKLLEIVMPCDGGGAMLITSAERATRTPHRPTFVSGYGEFMTHKSITNMPDFLHSPLAAASERAFRMAGMRREEIDLACLYDSFTITVLLAIEGAGFCKPGQGQAFVREHDLRYHGDWPLNTHGGQLSFGQPRLAGGLSHFIEATRQIQGRADARQIAHCDRAFCSGSGGMLSEQIAVILEGA